MDIYAEVLEKLKASGDVYPAYSTADEVEERHKAAGRDPKLGYDNYDRDLTDEQIAAFRDEGRQPVWRLRMPQKTWTWHDLVRGDMSRGRHHRARLRRRPVQRPAALHPGQSRSTTP
jgi:glutamyl-tRNA synthetase